METLSWLSVIPPILVVVLAISTRSIIFSLIMGIVCGLGIFGVMASPAALPDNGFFDMLLYGLQMTASSAGTPGNLLLILFLAILGGIIAILTAAGCSNSFSGSAVRWIKSRRRAEGFTFLLGCLISVDDYFNAITVGNVMVSITDKFKISRARLAYLIDSTSAPVTILMPVSSWVATVISLITPELEAYGMAQPGMQVFLRATVYNFYAWFTLFMVACVIIFKINIGPMRRFEEDFVATGKDGSIFVDINETVVEDMAHRQRGTALDMFIVLMSLMVFTFGMMLYTGGFFRGGTGVFGALMCCDPNISLAAAALMSLALCFLMFVLPGKLSFSKFNDAFIQGVKTMVTSILILVLSWSFSALMGSDGLMTGDYIAHSLEGLLSAWMMPAAIFIISALISFSTGASWGAMGIMLPTSIAVCAAVDKSYIYLVIGAALAGSVFGDHCSPLSDTTILSSSGAGCKHLDHVSSQLPYAISTAAICFIAFLIAGLTRSVWMPFLFGTLAILLFSIAAGPRKITVPSAKPCTLK